jgi:hypothetical protein
LTIRYVYIVHTLHNVCTRIRQQFVPCLCVSGFYYIQGFDPPYRPSISKATTVTFAVPSGLGTRVCDETSLKVEQRERTSAGEKKIKIRSG